MCTGVPPKKENVRQKTFSHHCQGRIDFNTAVNIHHKVGIDFLTQYRFMMEKWSYIHCMHRVHPHRPRLRPLEIFCSDRSCATQSIPLVEYLQDSQPHKIAYNIKHLPRGVSHRRTRKMLLRLGESISSLC